MIATYSDRRSVVFALLAGSVWGCVSPCATGFSRDDDGVCVADVQCPEGYARGTSLACDPVEQSTDDNQADRAFITDTAGPQDTGLLGEVPTESEDGNGRILIRYDGLQDLSMHGFLVMGKTPNDDQPTAAFCQVVLAQSVDIAGVLNTFDGVSEDCPLEGSPAMYPPGPVQLTMEVLAGAAAEPVLCDERIVHVDGDTVVDFGDVIDCQR